MVLRIFLGVGLLGGFLLTACLDLDSLQSSKPVAPPDGGSQAADAGGAADLGLAIGPAPGCASGMGYASPSFPKVNACPGVWGPSLVLYRCAPGWRLCQKAPPLEFCIALPRFFMSNQPVAQSSPWPPDSTMRCSWDGSTATSPRGVAGCGLIEGTYQAELAQCGGFPTVEPCGANGWSCSGTSDSDFLSIKNDNPDDGVLCCDLR